MFWNKHFHSPAGYFLTSTLSIVVMTPPTPINKCFNYPFIRLELEAAEAISLRSNTF